MTLLTRMDSRFKTTSGIEVESRKFTNLTGDADSIRFKVKPGMDMVTQL